MRSLRHFNAWHRSARAIGYLVPACAIVALPASGCGSVEPAVGTGGSGGTGSGTSMGSNNAVSSGSGSLSSTGSGGTGVTSVGPPVAELDPRDVAIAAVFVGSCMPDDGIGRNLNRFYTNRGGQIWYEQPIVDRLACLKGKTNGCKAVEECFGYHIDQTGPCTTSCTDGVIAICEGVNKFQIDCKKVGLGCTIEAGFCVQTPPPASCDVTTYEPKCDAGAPVKCSKGQEIRGPICADYSLECGGGSINCHGIGPACTQADPTASPDAIDFGQGIACDEQKLRVCVRASETLIDCGTLGKGFTCQTGTNAFCGLAAECTPSAHGGQATCEGTTAVFCNAGRIEKVDCTTLGFTGCNTALGGCTPTFIN